MSESAHPLHPWAVRTLLILLIAGLAAATGRALFWSGVERHRTLVVLAPTHADIAVQGGPDPLSDTDGVYSFEVTPGPLTLEVKHPELPPQTVPLTIPKGIGGLMVDVDYDAEGRIRLGYF